MSLGPGFLDFAQRQGDLLLAKVTSRDNVHLSPVTFSKAAATRLKTGLRALQAYVRRLILLLALSLEPELDPNTRAQMPRQRNPDVSSNPQVRIFTGEQDCPDFAGLGRDPWADHNPAKSHRGAPVLAAPLLARLSALKALLEAPTARAKRLAFHLARHRPGWLMPPGREAHVPRRFGTELSALYEGLAQAIISASKIRPPPLGPAPNPGPRIRAL